MHLYKEIIDRIKNTVDNLNEVLGVSPVILGTISEDGNILFLDFENGGCHHFYNEVIYLNDYDEYVNLIDNRALLWKRGEEIINSLSEEVKIEIQRKYCPGDIRDLVISLACGKSLESWMEDRDSWTPEPFDEEEDYIEPDNSCPEIFDEENPDLMM